MAKKETSRRRAARQKQSRWYRAAEWWHAKTGVPLIPSIEAGGFLLILVVAYVVKQFVLV